MSKHSVRERKAMIRAFMDVYKVNYTTASRALSVSDRQLGFQSRLFCVASLPREDPGTNTALWQRRNGNLVLTAGQEPVEDGLRTVGLPFGATARALAAYLTTELVRHGGLRVELPSSPVLFLQLLLTSSPGGDVAEAVEQLRLQAQRLFATTFRVRWSAQSHAVSKDMRMVIASAWNLEWDIAEGVTGFVECTPEFAAEATVGGPVPLDLDAYFGMSDSAFCMDLYAWLQARMSYLRKPVTVPLPMLRDQLGPAVSEGVEGVDEFRQRVIEGLRRVLKAYPEAGVDVVEDGVRLRPSPAHVTMPVAGFRG
jgi:Plasmid encoded RepA protein